MREGLFKNIITKNLKWFICIGVLFLVTSGISIATSTILMKIIDEVLPLRNFDKLMEVICIYVLLSLLQEIFSYTCSYANMVFTNKTEIKYKQTIIDKILNKQGDFFVKNNSGNLFQTINGDIAQVCSFIVGNIFLLMYTVFSLLTSAIYLFVLNPILLLIIFLLQPFSVILQKVVAPKIAKYSNECRDIVGKYILAMQDIFVRPIDIVLSGLKNSLVDRVNKKLYEQYHMRKRMFLVDSLCSQMSEFLRTLTMCAVIGYGGYCIINGSMSVGVLVIFITYSQRLMSHIERLLNFTLDFSEIKPIYERVNVFFIQEDIVKSGKINNKKNPNIELVNVSFAYDGERELYHKLNYVFEYGKKYGIVGRTGEGKSTFVKLMFNIWSPCGGNVYIGESDCTQIANKEINDMILYISSEPIIINDTVYNNIALERKGVEEKEILLALKKVCLYNEITKMEQGIYTVVGDKGSALSSGEKQRLALARALISKKQIVILDEPTAALDEVTRDMVMQNIYEELAGRTLIIIAHDRSILKSCDKILCLKDGKLKEFNAEINCN